MAGAEIEKAVSVEISDGVVLDFRDGKVKQSDGRPARHCHVARRYDIPKDHPLYGLPALRVVLSGMPDMTIDDEGKMVPIDVETGLPTDIEGKPVLSEQAPVEVSR